MEQNDKPTIPAPPYREQDPYCKLGNEKDLHQPEGVWELILSDFTNSINPRDYFVTSGEAVQKAKKLEEDIWLLAGKARKLRNLLEKARGSSTYLETEWTDGGRLLLKKKDPRNKKPKKDE